jgi:hypothetical protein
MTLATLAPPPDLDEAFALFREDRSAPPVRKETTPTREYCRLPFRKFVPPPLAEPDLEPLARAEWRQRFDHAGIRVDLVSYGTSSGPRWNAYLALQDGNRRFAVCLDRGLWTELGTLRRDIPFEQLAARVEQILGGKIDVVEPAPAAQPIVPTDPPEVLWLRECARRGVELEERPDGSIRGLYRGIELWLLPDRRLVQYGRRVSGGRTYNHYPLAEAIRLADSEFGSPPVKPTAKGRLF